jgi:glutamine amidotransferase-like uncharacterized protein
MLQKIYIKLLILLVSFSFDAYSLNVRDVAIYDDRNLNDGGAWRDSIFGVRRVLEDNNYTWESIDADDVNNNNLTSYYKLIVFPGGWAGGYNEYINSSGYQNIRDFVSNGGSYLGLCAGSFFACDKTYWREGSILNTPQNTYNYPLNLWDGIGDGVIRDFVYWGETTYHPDDPSSRMTDIKIDTELMPEAEPIINVLYFGGPVFRPYAGKWGNTQVIARYEMDGFSADEFAAMILFPYGNGKVFLSAVHPEVSVYNYYSNDQGRIASYTDYGQYNDTQYSQETTIKAQNFLSQIIARLVSPEQEINATASSSKKLSFNTKQGSTYQIQNSQDGVNWSNQGESIVAEGFEYTFSVQSNDTSSYRILLVE